MRRLTLVEYQTSPAVPLRGGERDALQRLVPHLTIVPSLAADDGQWLHSTSTVGTAKHSPISRYDLTPGAWIGAIQIGKLAVEIRPKLPISRLLFLLSAAVEGAMWPEERFDHAAALTVGEAVGPLFAEEIRRATRRGLLQRYESTEASTTSMRGRIRFEAQLRERLGQYPPVEVRHDDLTVDVVENRLLKSALTRLQAMPLLAPSTRQRLKDVARVFEPVSTVTLDPAHLPVVACSQINEHYRPALALAEVILRSSSLELRHGSVVASALLLNMNQIFETFVVRSLRRSLGLTEDSFPQGLSAPLLGSGARPRLSLDVSGRIGLEPDLSWWEGGQCWFAGDVKYKRVGSAGVEHDDLYQVLAYVIAAGLPGGLLIYAAGEADPVTHVIQHAGKTLHVAALDLSAPPSAMMRQIDDLADLIRDLRTSARRLARRRPSNRRATVPAASKEVTSDGAIHENHPHRRLAVPLGTARLGLRL